mgnify:CR=1 FL=1
MADAAAITIYHNPACGTSRNTLAMIRQSGENPRVIEYLKTPPSRDELKAIAAATGEPLRALLRTRQAQYAEQGLDNPALTDDQLLDAMLATPVLINRPIVVTPQGARTDHFHAPRTLAELAELGVDPVGMPFHGIVYDDGRRRAKARFRAGPGRGVRRTTLHAALAQQAKQVGVGGRVRTRRAPDR